ISALSWSAPTSFSKTFWYFSKSNSCQLNSGNSPSNMCAPSMLNVLIGTSAWLLTTVHIELVYILLYFGGGYVQIKIACHLNKDIATPVVYLFIFSFAALRSPTNNG